MAAGTIAAQKTFTGLRPVHLRQDLADIADLIEYCFAPSLDAGGRSAIQEMRMMSRSGPLLWALGRLSSALPGGLMQGFVWIEKGRLVGNVSISPAGYGRGYVIANVAVYPDYRRRGIARQLMQAALDLVARHGTFAMLQVEADNEHARTLYDSLGFEEQRAFIRWRRSASYSVPPVLQQKPVLRPVTRRDAGALAALARRVRPETQGGMGWLRPQSKQHFGPSHWGNVMSFLSGQHESSWVVPGADGGIDAALLVETRFGAMTQLFDLLVCPEEQGHLEAPLLNDLIVRLGGRHRPLVTDHPADDDAAVEALRQHYFRPERTLVHMIWPVPHAGRPRH